MGAMSLPVLVTGATGRLGRHVVDQLVSDGIPVRALVRGPHDLPESVETVTGDLTVPESLDDALRGAGPVFLLWTAPPRTAPAVVERLAGHRVVYLSAPHRTPHPLFRQPNPMAAMHAEIEGLLNGAVVVRPGMLASNARLWWSDAIHSGEPIRWPYGDVETAPVDDRDVAAVVARVLLDDAYAGDDVYTGDYVLTGPESLSHRDQVRILGEVLGREMPYQEMESEEFRRLGPAADMLLAAWKAAAGQPAYITSTVADILGRPARTFREWAENLRREEEAEFRRGADDPARRIA